MTVGALIKPAGRKFGARGKIVVRIDGLITTALGINRAKFKLRHDPKWRFSCFQRATLLDHPVEPCDVHTSSASVSLTTMAL